MKFAIRKLALTCVLPTALWQVPLMSDVLAQDMPSAVSKANAGQPQKLRPSTKKPPQGAFQTSGNPGADTVAPGPVIRAANNPAPQAATQQQGSGSIPGETGVQRELRLLYERSGREMPVMNLDEIEIPEPQAGVAPNGAAPNSAQGSRQPNAQYAPPPIAPRKAPNFFERVFLGRKAPVPQQVQPPRTLVPPAGQSRPVQTGNPSVNYRPYQPAPQVNQGQGRSVGTFNPPAVTQPQITSQPANPQVTVPQQSAVQPAPQITPRPPVPAKPLAPIGDPPLLDSEPEESMEIELDPHGGDLPVTSRPGVIPAPIPGETELKAEESATPTMSADDIPEEDAPQKDDSKAADAESNVAAEENPFSGLQLNLPDMDVPAPAANSLPAVKTPSAASNAVLSPSTNAKSVEAPLNEVEDPFLERTSVEPSKTPARPAPSNAAAAPKSLPTDGDPFLDDPFAEKPAQPAKTDSIVITPKTPAKSTIAVAPKKPVEPAPASVTPKAQAETSRRAETAKASDKVTSTPSKTAGQSATSATTPRTAAKPDSVPTTPLTSASPTKTATSPRISKPTGPDLAKPQSPPQVPNVVKLPEPRTPATNGTKPSPGTAAPNAANTVSSTPSGLPAKPAPSAESTAKQAAPKVAGSSITDEISKKLADASETTGLKGFCPVALRQKRQLIESKVQFNATHHGKKYHFSTAEAKATFEKEPQLYAPAHDGLDGVALNDKKSLPGKLDFAAWFQGRLYLFSTRENMVKFMDDPEVYLDDTQETTVTITTAPRIKSAETSAPNTQPRNSQGGKTATVSATTAAKPTTSRTTNAAAVKPAVQSTSKLPALMDELPVLSDNLDDLVPLAPPSTSGGTTGQAPAPLRSAGTSVATPAKDAPAPVAPKTIAPPARQSPATPRGLKLDAPRPGTSTKNVPASFVAPAKPEQDPKAPPRLINPEMKLAPR